MMADDKLAAPPSGYKLERLAPTAAAAEVPAECWSEEGFVFLRFGTGTIRLAPAAARAIGRFLLGHADALDPQGPVPEVR